MNTTDWLKQCRAHQTVLRSVVEQYYPTKNRRETSMEITASRAEIACQNVRDIIIRRDGNVRVLKPEIRFDSALANNDAADLYDLLSSTWFGVPESTSCWDIVGFKELVDLLDEPPDEILEEEEED